MLIPTHRVLILSLLCGPVASTEERELGVVQRYRELFPSHHDDIPRTNFSNDTLTKCQDIPGLETCLDGQDPGREDTTGEISRLVLMFAYSYTSSSPCCWSESNSSRTLNVLRSVLQRITAADTQDEEKLMNQALWVWDCSIQYGNDTDGTALGSWQYGLLLAAHAASVLSAEPLNDGSMSSCPDPEGLKSLYGKRLLITMKTNSTTTETNVQDWKAWISTFVSVTIINLSSLLGAGLLLVKKKGWFPHLLMFMMALAAGTLLSDAVLHLIPDGVVCPMWHEVGINAATPWRALQDRFLCRCDSSTLDFYGSAVSQWFRALDVGHDDNERSIMSNGTITVAHDEEDNFLLIRCVVILCGVFTFYFFEVFCRIAFKGHDHSHDIPTKYDKDTNRVEVMPSPRMPDDRDLDVASMKEKADQPSVGADDVKISANTTVVMVNKSGGSGITFSNGGEEGPAVEIHALGSQKAGNESIGEETAHKSKWRFLPQYPSVVWMLILGDALHNSMDGLAIGANFARSNGFQGGLSISIAILCHEIPHELGDLAAMVSFGISIRRSLVLNLVSSCSAYIGGIIGVLVGQNDASEQYVFGFTAGLFLYIALVDLVPAMVNSSLLRTSPSITVALQVLGMGIGCAVMVLLALYEHSITI